MWEITVDMERGQIPVFTPVSQGPSDLLFTSRTYEALRGFALFPQCLILTVHKPVKLLEETMWRMFTRMSAFFICWCENRKIVFSGCVSITLHLAPVPRECLIIEFYFNAICTFALLTLDFKDYYKVPQTEKVRQVVLGSLICLCAV